MLPEPLHPAIVHFPLAFGTLLPLAIAWGFVQSRKGSPRLAWVPALTLSLLLAVSATIAAETGEDEEDVVEPIVTEQVLEEHEEAAQLFQRASIGVLLLMAMGIAPPFPARIAKGFQVAAFLGSLALLPLLVRAGHTGGNLVYEHGAAQAYVSSSSSTAVVSQGDD